MKHPFLLSGNQDTEAQIFIEFSKFYDLKEHRLCSLSYDIMPVLLENKI